MTCPRLSGRRARPQVADYQKCHKTPKVVTGVKIEAEFPNLMRGADAMHRDYVAREKSKKNGTSDEREHAIRLASDLQDAVNEFHDFIRDHRSQDAVHLEVVRIEEHLCSKCGRAWESYTETENGETKEFCASCGAEVEAEAPTTKEAASG